ncbi:MAG TPA: GspH/FimT family pseudopilin [Casimicrobiaceae bacterium]
MTMRFRGFTLIELMIALAIFGLLIMLAGPQLAAFMGNSQIRNAAEAMLNGVQHAQSTAIRGNTLTRLVVDPTTGTGGWQVLETIEGLEPSPPNPIQVYAFIDGAPKVTVARTPADATQITFDGFGRIVPNIDASPTLTCLKVRNPNVSTPRNLNVAISSSGLSVGSKLCDPDAAATEPQACPAGCA